MQNSEQNCFQCFYQEISSDEGVYDLKVNLSYCATSKKPQKNSSYLGGLKTERSISLVKFSQGSFNKCVDIILPFLDYLLILTLMLTFFILNVDKNRHWLTSYPPHVYVVLNDSQVKESWLHHPLWGYSTATWTEFCHF